MAFVTVLDQHRPDALLEEGEAGFVRGPWRFRRGHDRAQPEGEAN
jgi:hypothetical protein